jgi:hypothetical protein
MSLAIGRLRELSEPVIEGNLDVLRVFESVRDSGGDSGLRVESLDGSKSGPSAHQKPVQYLALVGPHGSHEGLHGFEPRAHRHPAPGLEVALGVVVALEGPELLQAL